MDEIIENPEAATIRANEKNDVLESHLKDITTADSCQVESKVTQIELLQKGLTANWDFRYNIISSNYEFRSISPLPSESPGDYHKLTDRDFNAIWQVMCKIFACRIDAGGLWRIINSHYAVKFDPIEEYFANLPSWDAETDYIEQLAAVVTVKEGQEAIWRLYLSRWLVASVACMRGHAVNHNCLILLGPQGCGKSTFLNALGISKELTFAGHISPGNKDSLILVAEKTLVNLDELESSTREDWSFIKSLITIPKISVRRPYARIAEELPRRASFCGSANKTLILGDLTGSRRWLCVEVEAIQYNEVTPELMRHVYAQAQVMFKEGVKYWFDGNEIEEIDVVNQQYYEPKPEEEAIRALYEPAEPHEADRSLLTTTEIQQEVKTMFSGVNFSTKKIGHTLHGLQFKQVMGRRRAWSVRRIHEPASDSQMSQIS